MRMIGMYEYQSLLTGDKYYSSVEYDNLNNYFDEFGGIVFYSFKQLKELPEKEYIKSMRKLTDIVRELYIKNK